MMSRRNVFFRNRLSTLAIAASVLCVLAVTPVAGQAWVSFFGGDTVYQPPRYLSGYGVSDLADGGERPQAARGDALREQFLRDAEDSAARFMSGVELFDRAFSGGNLRGAEEALQRAEAALSPLYDAFTVVRALDLLAERAGVAGGTGVAAGVDVAGELVAPFELERRAIERRGSLKQFRPPSVSAAADVLARKLVDQLEASRQSHLGDTYSAAVMPLLYQDADFSSPFGVRMAGLVSSALAEVRGLTMSGSGRHMCPSPPWRGWSRS